MYRHQIRTGRWLRLEALTSRTNSIHAFARSLLAVAILAPVAIACAPLEERPKPFPGVKLTATAFVALPDWQRDRHDDALSAFKLSCPKLLKGKSTEIGGRVVRPADWRPICLAAKEPLPSSAATTFFERWFVPYLVATGERIEGLFTGYFEAELRGTRTRSDTNNVPLFGIPNDLVSVDLGRFQKSLRGRKLVGRIANGELLPYHRRDAIQRGALEGFAPVIAWLDDEIDAFLLHVQGSGRILLEDGNVMRVGFAGHNGYNYVSIGRALIDAGELMPNQASWGGIRNWVSQNPVKAQALLARNPRYIFFREITGAGPIGAQGVPLTPRRSLAVDPKYIPFGAPLWLDTVWPGGGKRPLRRLMIAQDAGNAIKGPIRGDFFWGYGKDALAEAGRMKSRGRYYILLPRSTVVPLS